MQMTLLSEIQDAAVDGRSDLATVLRKCKVLAARLGSKPLEDWLLWESNGYPDNVPVPDYRIWPLEIKGDFSGYAGSGLKNAPVPIACLSAKNQKQVSRYECRTSIASVESTIVSGSKSLSVPIEGLALALGTNVYQHQNCIRAWGTFGIANLTELTNAVRNRILDFLLAIEKEAPEAGELPRGASRAMEATRVTQIFNTTVNNGSANIVGTANSSSLEFHVGMNDFAALAAMLRDHGVQEAELADLKAALDAEPDKPVDGKFGPRVADWIGSMVAKAATGGWAIAAGAAGNLLATAIGKYYGF